MMFQLYFLFAIFAIFINYAMASEKVVMCYYSSWAAYRPGRGKFEVENIDVDLCTHLVYTFVGINNEGKLESIDPYMDFPDNWGRNNLKKFTDLKLKNRSLKTLLAVGGWNEGSAKYSQMAAIPALRRNFVDTTINMLRKYGFDGLDLDWEYPNQRDTVYGEDDLVNFTQLLKEMREAFDRYGYILTVAVASDMSIASEAYDISAFSQYVDLVAIMTYDMNLPTNSATGHNAPLYKGEGEENIPKKDAHTVDAALDYWLNQGCPPEKLVLGVPFYAHAYTLTDPNTSGVRAPTYGSGITGPYTETIRFIGYNELCEIFKNETWDKRYDKLAKVPYAVQGRNWISYDNADSIATKTRYALDLGLAGVMVWSIETDDFLGYCGERYPLLQTINRSLGRIISSVPSNKGKTSGDL